MLQIGIILVEMDASLDKIPCFHAWTTREMLLCPNNVPTRETKVKATDTWVAIVALQVMQMQARVSTIAVNGNFKNSIRT